MVRNDLLKTSNVVLVQWTLSRSLSVKSRDTHTAQVRGSFCTPRTRTPTVSDAAKSNPFTCSLRTLRTRRAEKALTSPRSRGPCTGPALLPLGASPLPSSSPPLTRVPSPHLSPRSSLLSLLLPAPRPA
eukprot:3743379-Rhodomonas_salina.2